MGVGPFPLALAAISEEDLEGGEVFCPLVKWMDLPLVNAPTKTTESRLTLRKMLYLLHVHPRTIIGR